ncbi:unnamed protein product [Tenebrio molitor]|nr:unnamed protein product [Tenebrio molitor]
MQGLIRGNSLLNYFLRMSWVHKVEFLTKLIKRCRTIGTLSLLLNTLYSVTGKIVFYCKSTTRTPINYDKILNDHDRMLDFEVLQENIHSDLLWFETIDDKEQAAYVITLLRISGGAIISKLYKRILKLYTERVHELALLASASKEANNSEEEEQQSKPFEYPHDPDDPKHQKCLKLEKLWNETMVHFRKEVEKHQPKTKKEKDHAKKGKKKKKGSKTKSTGKSKKGKKKGKKGKKKKKGKKRQPVDWIQIMPIWLVKKIFSYLDKKSLARAKKVNEFWKWAVTELLKDRKARKLLDKANQKLKDAAGGECALPEDVTFKTPTPRVSHTQKRINKLQERGTILEELRHISDGVLDTRCLVVEACRTFADTLPYFDQITMFPRFVRTNSPLYKKPKYIVKDYKIIYEEPDDSLSVSLDDAKLSRHVYSSDESTSSDEMSK